MLEPSGSFWVPFFSFCGFGLCRPRWPMRNGIGECTTTRAMHLNPDFLSSVQALVPKVPKTSVYPRTYDFNDELAQIVPFLKRLHGYKGVTSTFDSTSRYYEDAQWSTSISDNF